MPTIRVAAIDCGTNSLRLLIAETDSETGQLVDLLRRTEVVRLGEGVDRTHRFAETAIVRTMAVVDQYAAAIHDADVSAAAVRFVATSAARDATNVGELDRRVRAVLGTGVEVVSGVEEAGLSFRGAVSTLRASWPAPYLVVDLGGGSTELVLGSAGPEQACSMDVGCVRLTERLHAHGEGSRGQQLVRDDVDRALDAAEKHVDLRRARTLIGVAGTVTTITAHALGLTVYDRERVDGVSLPVDRVLEACRELRSMSGESRGALPYVHPGRVDVLPAGCLIWEAVIERVRRRTLAAGSGLGLIVTSERDILDGLAADLADRLR